MSPYCLNYNTRRKNDACDPLSLVQHEVSPLFVFEEKKEVGIKGFVGGTSSGTKHDHHEVLTERTVGSLVAMAPGQEPIFPRPRTKLQSR